MSEVGPLKVRGFSKATLEGDWKDRYGKPVSEGQDGWMALDQASRASLGVKVGEVVEVVRGDLAAVVSFLKMKIVPGMDPYLGLTGTARESLELVNFKEEAGSPSVGDMVMLLRNGAVIEVRKVLE